MSNIKNVYIKDPGKCLTPVYAPFETYSFVANFTKYLSHPQWQLLELRLYDALTGLVASTDFPTLGRAFPIVGSNLFVLHSTFPMPVVPNGYYYFAVYDSTGGIDEIAISTNVVQVERDVLDTTIRLEFWHDDEYYGVPYPQISAQTNSTFKQMFRLPLSLIDLQYESDKTTYRNITDRVLRTLQSYRDANAKIQARNFDLDAMEALSAAIEHKYCTIDGIPVEPKTALQIQTNAQAALNNASFDAYTTPENRNGIFGLHGDNVYICGNATFNPDNIIHPI